MTTKEFTSLAVGQKVKVFRIALVDSVKLICTYEFGHVTKLYNGNWQLQVLINGEKKPVTVGYKRVELIKD